MVRKVAKQYKRDTKVVAEALIENFNYENTVNIYYLLSEFVCYLIMTGDRIVSPDNCPLHRRRRRKDFKNSRQKL